MKEKELNIEWRETLRDEYMISEDFITEEGFRFVLDTQVEPDEDEDGEETYIVSVSVTTSGSSGESDIILEYLPETQEDEDDVSVDDVVIKCYNTIKSQQAFPADKVDFNNESWTAPNGWTYMKHEDGETKTVIVVSGTSDMIGGVPETILMNGGDWMTDIDTSDKITPEWAAAKHYTLYGWLANN